MKDRGDEKIRCGVISIGLPWFDVEYAKKCLHDTRAFLIERLGDRVETAGPEDVVTHMECLKQEIQALKKEQIHVLVMQVASFPDGEMPLLVAEELEVPVVVHSIPEPDISTGVAINSLCGANMISCTFAMFDKPYAVVHGSVNSTGPEGKNLDGEPSGVKLAAAVLAGAAVTRLKGTRVGLIGFRAPGFFPCVFDEVELRKKLGVSIDHIGLNELERELQNGTTRPAPRDKFPLISGGELPKSGVEVMEKLYGALTAVVRRFGHGVIAIKDWPEFFDAERIGAFWPVLGWIQQEDGLVLGPEGDVNSAVTMALQQIITGGLTAMIDISAFNAEDSTLLLWHYGVPETMAAEPEEIKYCEYGREVEFTLEPGKATLVKVGMYKGNLRLLAISVEILDERITIRRAGGKARTCKTAAPKVMQTIIKEGWEHHVCLVYGDISSSLEAFANMTGIEYTGL